jgi:hypothetical protein
MSERSNQWAKIAGGKFSHGDRTFVSRLEKAQRATMSKMVMEVPDLAQFGMNAGKIARDEIDAWAQIGVRMWNLDQTTRPRGMRMKQDGEKPAQQAQAYATFDERSLLLIAWLHDLHQNRSTDAQLATMLARLEYTVIADTALDELQLRQQIRAKLASEPAMSFDKLNAWIYADVFHTPKSDPWLGLVPRTDFSGLPGDGVVTR